MRAKHPSFNVNIRGSSPLRATRHNSAPGYAVGRKEFDAGRCSIVPALFMKFYYVYILQNKFKNFIYIGYSENLKKRFNSHNRAENKSTKAYLPLDLIHYEAYRNISDAKRREEYLKTNRGRKTLITMLTEYFKNL